MLNTIANNHTLQIDFASLYRASILSSDSLGIFGTALPKRHQVHMHLQIEKYIVLELRTPKSIESLYLNSTNPLISHLVPAQGRGPLFGPIPCAAGCYGYRNYG